MSSNPYALTSAHSIVSAAAVDERVAFIRRTYLHLAGAVIGFLLLQLVIFTFFNPQLEMFAGWAFGSRLGWLAILGGFMLVSWLADSWAHSGQSLSVQYGGLGLYTVAQSLILAPLLYVANQMSPTAIPMAGLTTGIIFGGLSLFVIISRIDFSFLRMFLLVAGLAAVAFVVASLVFDIGGGLGLWFSGAMVVLMSGYILYHTSNILHHYRTDQHVAAALALFASLGTLFWYVLQLFMSRD